MEQTDRFRVLIMPGSVRRPSHTVALARKLKATFQHPFDAILLEDIAAPPADPRFHRNPLDHELPEIQRLAELAQSCDAFIWVSPVYHNSYSSHLKTLLDHLSIRQFKNKVVGLASHGSNRSPQAVDHLRIVARGLNAITPPSQVCTAESDYQVNAHNDYDVVNPDIMSRVIRLVHEVSAMTISLAPLRARAYEAERRSGVEVLGRWASPRSGEV